MSRFYFEIRSNNAGNSDILADQLFVVVEEGGLNQASFTFYNGTNPDTPAIVPGWIQSFINEIYWDDNAGVLSGPIANVNYFSSGTQYQIGATPADLPGGGSSFSADFSAEPTTEGANQLGIDAPSDYHGFLFDIVGGKDFDDVLAALETHELLIGLHVKGIAGTLENGASDAFVNNGTTGIPVPEPATMLLLGAGLLGLAGFGRKKLIRKIGFSETKLCN